MVQHVSEGGRYLRVVFSTAGQKRISLLQLLLAVHHPLWYSALESTIATVKCVLCNKVIGRIVCFAEFNCSDNNSSNSELGETVKRTFASLDEDPPYLEASVWVVVTLGSLGLWGPTQTPHDLPSLLWLLSPSPLWREKLSITLEIEKHSMTKVLMRTC